VEAGIIMALLLMIVATKIHLPEQPNQKIVVVQNEETTLVLPPSISETKEVRQPPIPMVPVAIPNDAPIAPPPIELYKYNLTARLIIPPLPVKIYEIENKNEIGTLPGTRQYPVMIGGEGALRNSIRYPEYALKQRIEGTVKVEFVVDKDGKVLDPVIISGIGGGCDVAVLRAIKRQKFKPGKIAGENVSFRITEMVEFILLDT
jgi:protein TonB